MAGIVTVTNQVVSYLMSRVCGGGRDTFFKQLKECPLSYFEIAAAGIQVALFDDSLMALWLLIDIR
jgi:hypothetical protein